MHHRQPPQCRQIHRSPEVAGVRGAVAEHAYRDVVGAEVIGGEAEPRRERQVSADDPVAAHEPPLAVEDVHRAAASAGRPVDAPEELRHHVVGIGAARDRVSVGPVGPDQVVAGPHRGGRARRSSPPRRSRGEGCPGLPPDLAPRLLLEAPDERHHLEQLERGRRVGKRAPRRRRAVSGIPRCAVFTVSSDTPPRNIASRRPAASARRRLDRLLEPVVTPEHLSGDDHVGTPRMPRAPARPVASRSRSLIASRAIAVRSACG